MAWPSEGPFVAKMLKPRMSAWGQQQTLGEFVSDVRFGAESRPKRAASKIHDTHVCLRAVTGPRSVSHPMSAHSSLSHVWTAPCWQEFL